MINDIDWLIIGSRRWARIIAIEICKLEASVEVVKIYDDSNDSSLAMWLENSPYKHNLKIINQINICHHSKTGLAIIANSAYLHYVSIDLALKSGYNVISEKPMTFSRFDTDFLLDKAKKLGLELFSTNTYYFADYFRVLRNNYLVNKKISKIYIHWADPVLEFRHGEKKSYDSSTPIIYDLLPHIAVIILATYGNFQIKKSDIEVLRGGSEVKINYTCNELLISISLERNSSKRTRTIYFFDENVETKFDFTEEPGKVISDDYVSITPDARWDLKCKPLAEMLNSLKNYFKKGIQDRRLSSDAAILSNDLIDSIANDYVDQLLKIFKFQAAKNDLDFAYAKKEIDSLNKRVLQNLPSKSPLHRIALRDSVNY